MVASFEKEGLNSLMLYLDWPDGLLNNKIRQNRRSTASKAQSREALQLVPRLLGTLSFRAQNRPT